MIIAMVAVSSSDISKNITKDISFKELGINSVKTAHTEEDVKKITSKCTPDIIILDMNFENFNWIIEHIRTVQPSCRIILFHRNINKEDLLKAIKINPDGLIEEDITSIELRDMLKKLVNQIKTKRIENQKLENIQSRIEESIELCRQKLASDLTSKTDDAIIKQRMDFCGINLHSANKFMTIIIKFGNFRGFGIESIRKNKDEIIDEVSKYFSKNFSECLCFFKDDTYLVIHLYGSNTFRIHITQKLLLQLKKEITDITGYCFDIFIAIGKDVTDLKDIMLSYQSAVLSMQKLFFLGYDSVYKFSEHIGSSYELPEDKYNDFEFMIKNGMKNESIEFLEILKAEFIKNKSTLIDRIRETYIKISLIINKVVLGLEVEYSSLNVNLENNIREIYETDTIYRLSDCILDKLAVLFDEIYVREDVGSIIAGIMRFIRQKYDEEKLSLAMICEHSFFSQSYLCHIFKQKTGKTINSYITEVRIDKAKEFLKDKRIRLYDVSKKVGYSSPNHFAKTFKKHIGINPSEYRNKYLR